MQGQGPKFYIDIEGAVYPWDEDTITVSQLRVLGNLPTDLPVQEIDLQTNEARTLSEDEVVQLRPGLGFSKKVRYQRGWMIG